MTEPIRDRGLAVVLGKTLPSPFSLIDRAAQQMSANQKYQAELAEKRRQEINKRYDTVMSANFEELAKAEYTPYVENKIKQEFFEPLIDARKRGDVSDDLLAQAQKNKVLIDSQIRSINAKAKEIQEIDLDAKADPEKNYGFIKTYNSERLFDPETGQLTEPSNFVNLKPAEALSRPEAWNFSAIKQGIEKGIESDIDTQFDVQWVNGVQVLSNTTTASRYLPKDANGNAIYQRDENGRLILDVSPETVSLFDSHEGAKVHIDTAVEQLKQQGFDNATRKDGLELLLRGSAGVQRKSTASRIPESEMRKEATDANKRYQAARNLIYNTDQATLGQGYSLGNNTMIEYETDADTGESGPTSIIIKRREKKQKEVRNSLGIPEIVTTYEWDIVDEIPIKTDRQKRLAEGKVFSIISETQGKTGDMFRNAQDSFYENNPPEEEELSKKMNDLWSN